jgi:hypothetical protein
VKGLRVALVLGLCACASAGERPLRGEPSARAGLLQYGVGRLTFLAPDAWEATGGERRVRLVHPGNQGRLDVQQVERGFADEKQCLADAEQSLVKGSANLTNVRRHGSTFARRRAIAQEADQGGWHGWAWAVCDGGTQYRLFFAGRSPVPKDVLEAWRALTGSAAIGEGGRS